MALRLANKINRNIIQNFGKVLFTGKAQICNINEDVAQALRKDAEAASKQEFGSQFQSITQTALNSAASSNMESEVDIVQKNMQMHNLQPAMLPEYYKPPIDLHTRNFPKVQDGETSKAAAKYREFEKSTTYKNVKLPLKKPRLASPFPEPVKVMESDTMSDQEKAFQREVEARVPKSSAGSSGMNPFGAQSRRFSTVGPDESKCTKDKSKKKKCASIKGLKCAPAVSKDCRREYPFVKCEKKPAPYPSYSEFCHTIPYEHPSECKMCPWKPADHPTFKPTKKGYHTDRKGARGKRQLDLDRKDGWVEQEKWRKPAGDLQSDPLQKIAASTTLIDCVSHGMYLDSHKPCKPKNTSRCGKEKSKKKDKNQSGKKDKSKNDKKKGTTKKRNKSQKPKKKAAIYSTKSWITIADVESVRELPFTFNSRTIPNQLDGLEKIEEASRIQNVKAKGKEPGKATRKRGKCKKFPYSGCKIQKEDKEVPSPSVGSGCPKKKTQWPTVDDCPREEDKCKKDMIPVRPNSLIHLLGGKDQEGKDGKCRRIEVGVCKEDEEPEDPCGLKRKGQTKRCPGNLLDKKRRKPKKPKQKTAGVSTASPVPSTSRNPGL